MNWACKLGIGHDWEILDRINEGKLEQKLERQYFDNVSHRPRITSNILEKKHCKRCGIVIDEIAEFAQDYMETNRGKQRKPRDGVRVSYIY